jgi:hypothetical protein
MKSIIYPVARGLTRNFSMRVNFREMHYISSAERPLDLVRVGQQFSIIAIMFSWHGSCGGTDTRSKVETCSIYHYLYCLYPHYLRSNI